METCKLAKALLLFTWRRLGYQHALRAASLALASVCRCMYAVCQPDPDWSIVWSRSINRLAHGAPPIAVQALTAHGRVMVVVVSW